MTERLSKLILTRPALTGQFGLALQFDGSDDHIEVPGFTEDISELTISAWIKADDWNSNRRILQKGNDRQRVSSAGRRRVNSFLKSVQLVWKSLSLPATGKWVHVVAAVYDGSTMSLYYDKILKGSTSRSGMVPTTSSDLFLGTKNAGAPSGDRFKGIDG